MGLVEAMAEVDEAAEELGVVRHLGQFNSQSRKPAGDLHEVIAQTVLRASTRMIHPLNLGILAANRQTLNKPARKQTVPATSAEPKDTANEGKCVEGKTTEVLPKVTLLMMRMTDPVSGPSPDPEIVSGVVSEVVSGVVVTLPATPAPRGQTSKISATLQAGGSKWNSARIHYTTAVW